MEIIEKNLTIIIVLYKENFEIISKCLNNIKNFKIILIDNDGNLNLKKQVEENFRIHKYILNKTNLGFSRGINQAIKLSDTEYILNLEADCLIKTNDIEKLYNSINKYQNCIITTPTMYDDQNRLSNSGGTMIEKNLGNEIIKLDGDICVDYPMTAAILFRKKELTEIGLFDEDLFIYYPDNEIGRRISKLKKSVIQIYDARAIHVMGNLKVKGTLKKLFFRNYYFTIDELIYYYKDKKHYEPYEKLKKKIALLIIRSVLNLVLFRISKFVENISRVLAFYKFRKKFLKND